MIQACCVCGKVIHDGDKVQVLVTSTYHLLASIRAYALDKYDMEADSTTLCHRDCAPEREEEL